MDTICDYRSSVLKKLEKAVFGRDKKLIVEMAKKVSNMGFFVMELCLPTACEDEAEALAWAVSTVQEHVSMNFMINSLQAETIKEVLRVHKGPAWIYAVPCDREIIKEIFPLAAGTETRIVGQIATESGVPNDLEECLSLATDFFVGGGEFGLKAFQLFLDPVVLRLSSEEEKAGNILKLLGEIKKLQGVEVQTIFRLPNMGEKIPNKKRILLEQIYLTLAMQEGLDAVILDSYDERIIECINAVEFFQNKRVSIDLA